MDYYPLKKKNWIKRQLGEKKENIKYNTLYKLPLYMSLSVSEFWFHEQV